MRQRHNITWDVVEGCNTPSQNFILTHSHNFNQRIIHRAMTLHTENLHSKSCIMYAREGEAGAKKIGWEKETYKYAGIVTMHSKE